MEYTESNSEDHKVCACDREVLERAESCLQFRSFVPCSHVLTGLYTLPMSRILRSPRIVRGVDDFEDAFRIARLVDSRFSSAHAHTNTHNPEGVLLLLLLLLQLLLAILHKQKSLLLEMSVEGEL